MEMRPFEDISEKVFVFWSYTICIRPFTHFQLSQLLARNENLPEKDQFPAASFILDQDFFDFKLGQAENEIRKECATLEQEAGEHQKAVQAILSTFWLEMDDPSRSISVKHFILVLKSPLIWNFIGAFE